MAAPNHQESSPDSVGAEARAAIQLAASLVGLVGYVYLTGGILTWVRLATARLPADALTAVVDQRVLFAVGFKALLFMAAVFAVVSLVSYLAGGAGWGQHREEWHAIVIRGVREAATLHAREPATDVERATDGAPAQPHLGEGAVRTVAGFNVIVLAAIVGLSISRVVELIFPTAWVAIVAFVLVGAFVTWRLATWGPLRWGARGHGVALVFALAVAFFASAPIGVLVLASVAIAHLTRVIAGLRRPSSLAGFLRSPLPWGLVTVYVLVALAYVAQPPVTFTRAVLITKGEALTATKAGATTAAKGETLTGGYLARTSDGVYLVECRGLANATSSFERARLVPASEIESTTLGGEQYALDSGSRPSLATIVLRALGIDAHPPTWFRVALRARRPTCGGTLPPGASDGPLGAGVLVGPPPPGGRASGGEAPVEQTDTSALAQLARRYQPTLEVTVADRFWPVSVASVLQDRGTFTYGLTHGGHTATCLVRAGKCVASPPTLADLSATNASAGDSLDYPAGANRGDPTAQFEAFARGQGASAQTLSNWLTDPAALEPWRSAQIYFYDAGVGTYGTRYPGVPPGLRNLQYWFFYPYNYYPTAVAPRIMPTSPLAGDLSNTDLHEGDWEHVSVLLDPQTLTPRYLYMARHDTEGVTLPWDSPLLSFDEGHPIVQAAFGGHPSYPNRCGRYQRMVPALRHTPASDWVVCGSGRFAFRAATTPLVDLAHTSWACWPGHFGEATAAQLSAGKLPDYDPRRAFFKYVSVAGPPSPLRQAENTHAC